MTAPRDRCPSCGGNRSDYPDTERDCPVCEGKGFVVPPSEPPATPEERCCVECGGRILSERVAEWDEPHPEIEGGAREHMSELLYICENGHEKDEYEKQPPPERADRDETDLIYNAPSLDDARQYLAEHDARLTARVAELERVIAPKDAEMERGYLCEFCGTQEPPGVRSHGFLACRAALTARAEKAEAVAYKHCTRADVAEAEVERLRGDAAESVGLAALRTPSRRQRARGPREGGGGEGGEVRKPPCPPFPANGTLREKNDWLGGRIVEAERWLRSLHPWHRAFLEWKWFTLDPLTCKIRCWLKGETCPWE